MNAVARADERAKSVEQLAIDEDTTDNLLSAGQPQKFLGARSCAASACHGGIDPDPRFPLSQRNEYFHWLDRDPHARGYQTLQNDLSKAILNRLSRTTDDDATRVKRLANCFGCHNPQPEQAQRDKTYFTRDSVSCEICHGPAEKWIGTHVTESWQGLRGTVGATELGFINTEDITTRAETCAACHVGSPGREVNHDLIAAGHPALKFELTAYYAMLPKHWRDADERAKNSELENELWKAGQVACGESAIELLKWRAQRAADELPDATWPEFAEYDCFACHHELVHPSWRQAGPTSKADLGMPTWGSWYFSRLMQPAGDKLQNLTREMQSSYRPDPTAIIAAANAVRLSAPPIIATIGVPVRWDDATQQYLALVAREQAQRDLGKTPDDKVTSAIETLRKQLAFPLDRNSPHWQINSEPSDAGVTREQVYQSLLDLVEELQRRGDE